MSLLCALVLAASGLIAAVPAATFPPTPQGFTTLHSKLDPGVTISYKQTNICETTDGVKAYSGYVHLPPCPSEGRPYNVNTFFWFFEARKNPQNAPLSLWFQGGPGVPSTTAALGENGPCSVTNDSKNTVLNPWSWNNEVNMLYIDQPVQVGFSYDLLVNGTINELVSPVAVTVDSSNSASPPVNSTFLAGTFASQNNATTANTAKDAAFAIWHFMQAWVQEFPMYKPDNDKVSIWTESYGGHYGPTFADFFETQNDLISTGKLSSAVTLHLDTLGIINGCVDILTQMPAYPQMAFNNTYGLQIINETEFQSATESFSECEKLTLTCRSAVSVNDPQGFGNNEAANAACSDAFTFCFGSMWNAYNKYGRDVFDIARLLPDDFPPKYAAGFLNSRDVQVALGVPLNFTGESVAVSNSFTATGDFARDGNLEAIGRLLNRGVKVAFVYGDRDYQCNWIGGEQVSLAINSTFTAGFHAAGYTDIQNGNGASGGVVRQYGNLSFSRVFDAGHEVPYYQPETAYNIFSRTMFNTDVATGRIATGHLTNYSTSGPSSSFQIKNTLPAPQQSTCYLWDILETCTPTQKGLLQNGVAIVNDFIMVGFRDANGTAVYFGDGNSTTSNGTSISGSGGAQPSSIPNSCNPSMNLRHCLQVTAAAMAMAIFMLSL